MFTHEYPYTNFHELNLDWLINEFTNLVNEFSTVKVGFDEMKIKFEEIKTQFEGFDDAFNAFKQEIITQFGILSTDFEQRFNDLSQSIESKLTGIDDKIDQFKQEVEDDFTDFQTDVNAEITRFENEVDDKIENLNVTDAVNARIDTLVQDGTLQGMAYEVVGNIWNDITEYKEGQLVIHNNVLWKALQTSTNIEPVSGEYWQATNVINEIESSAKNAFHVITEESEFEGLTVTATLIDSPEGIEETHTAIIAGGYAQIPFNNIGTWKVSVTESTFEYYETVVVEYYSTYIVRLQKLNATINITTPDTQLFGKTVKIDNGTSIITGVLSSSGTLTKKVRELGTYVITCTDPSIGSRVPAVTVAVSAYNTYNAVLRYQYATITVKTSEVDLLGREVTATCEGQIYRGAFPAVLTEGYASVNLVVGKIGIYTITCTSSEGEEATESVEVTEFYQTVTAELFLSDPQMSYTQAEFINVINSGRQSRMRIGAQVKLNCGYGVDYFIVIGVNHDGTTNTVDLRAHKSNSLIIFGNTNDYPNASIRTWLNGTFFNSLDSVIQNLAKTMEIKCATNLSTGTTVNDKVKLLSCTELNPSNFAEDMPGFGSYKEGEPYPYFTKTAYNEVNATRGTTNDPYPYGMSYYTRSRKVGTTNVIAVNRDGRITANLAPENGLNQIAVLRF